MHNTRSNLRPAQRETAPHGPCYLMPETHTASHPQPGTTKPRLSCSRRPSPPPTRKVRCLIVLESRFLKTMGLATLTILIQRYRVKPHPKFAGESFEGSRRGGLKLGEY